MVSFSIYCVDDCGRRGGGGEGVPPDHKYLWLRNHHLEPASVLLAESGCWLDFTWSVGYCSTQSSAGLKTASLPGRSRAWSQNGWLVCHRAGGAGGRISRESLFPSCLARCQPLSFLSFFPIPFSYLPSNSSSPSHFLSLKTGHRRCLSIFPMSSSSSLNFKVS